MQGIAIWGSSCTLPNGLSTINLSSALSLACDLVCEAPVTRWEHHDLTADLELSVALRVRHGAFIDEAQLFDYRMFHMSLAETVLTDPQQRHVLERSADAICAACLGDGELGSSVGVAVGIYATEFGLIVAKGSKERSVYAGTASSLSVACANKVLPPQCFDFGSLRVCTSMSPASCLQALH